jgi:hypothetical protein
MSADTTGILQLASNNGTVALTISTAQIVSTNNDMAISGLTVGKGGGAVSTNTAVGASALSTNSAGAYITAIGYQALLLSTGNYNTAVGGLALSANTSGIENVAVGLSAMLTNTTGIYNTATGNSALRLNTTGGSNAAFGSQALYSNTTASNNTAVGYQAGYTNQTGAQNTFVGTAAGYSITSPSNVFIGYYAGQAAAGSSSGGNIAIGAAAGLGITSGTMNTIVGSCVYGSTAAAGQVLTTGTYNTFIGPVSGSVITTGSKNTILGAYTGNQNGLDIRTSSNRIVLSDGDGNPRGAYTDVGGNSAWCFSTSATPTRIGASECMQVDSNLLGYGIMVTGTSGTVAMRFYNQTPSAVAGAISFTGTTTTYGTSSDYRLKENVQPMRGALAKVALLKPVTYKWKADGLDGQGFIAHELQEVIPDSVYGEKDGIDDRGEPKYQNVDASFLVATLTAAIQELNAKVTALEEQVLNLGVK